jgi:hypothetical protein
VVGSLRQKDSLVTTTSEWYFSEEAFLKEGQQWMSKISQQKTLLYAYSLLTTFLLLLYPLSAHAESVTIGVIMRGTPCSTTYYVKKGTLPGPTVVVIGGIHGDETAGYKAAEQLVHWKINAGTLWVLPDANVEAIKRDIRLYQSNLNAMFPGKRNGTDMDRLA